MRRRVRDTAEKREKQKRDDANGVSPSPPGEVNFDLHSGALLVKTVFL
jgi:hypothetical protein